MNSELVKKEEPRVLNPSGRVASTLLTLFRPGRDYEGRWNAPAYSIFSNGNMTAIFISMESATRAVWNDVRQRYEAIVRAESISVGSDYNLPIGAITYVVSTDLVGFTGVVNEEPCIDGQDPKMEKMI
jgi:hypothetical protein